MSQGKSLTGVSRKSFILGLIIAILASSIISTIVAMQWAVIQGPKGDKGDEGDQGLQGPPGPAVVFAQWHVSWKTLTGDLQWSTEVGKSQFSSTFDYNWRSGTVFLEYADYIGFEATMQVKMQRDGPVTFTIGSDDAARLYIDGDLKIDDYTQHTYQTKSITINPSQGFHTLTLWYYEVGGGARVSFDCDSDILMWYA